MECRWQVEIDPYCQRVLTKHWPNVGRWDDVRTFPPTPAEDWRVDVICGGFPCQDISNAGLRAGIEGQRSRLWSEMRRVIREIRPIYVIVENVAALLNRGMGVVLGDLAACGFDAQWLCLSAAEFGAPHIRERIFILANAERSGLSVRRRAKNAGEISRRTILQSNDRQGRTIKTRETLADAISDRRKGKCNSGEGSGEGSGEFTRRAVAGASDTREWPEWEAEPAVGRVADGVPNRVDRLRGLGNAVVPQVAEWIGRRIIEANDGNA